MIKTILVTGGAGFIGSNFIKYLLKKYPEYFIVNADNLAYSGNLENIKELANSRNYLFVYTDICDVKQVAKVFHSLKCPHTGEALQIDIVVNFAAETHVDRSILDSGSFVKTNVLGTNNLLQVAKETWVGNNNNKLFIQISTDEVYGSLGEEGKFTENTPYNPQNPYAASKAAADHLVRSYFNTYSFPAIVTACSNNFGPYQFPEKLIPLMINNALNQKPLPVYGNGENVRDWIYVTDHCRALDRVMHYGNKGGTYNIGSGNQKKNIDVVELICNLLDDLVPQKGFYQDLITFVDDRPGHDMRYAMDYTKLSGELGWKPAYSFEKSLKDTIEWYLSNRSWIEKVVSGDYAAYYQRQYSNRLSY